MLLVKNFQFSITTKLRDAFKKKKSIWGDIVPTRGGGVKNDVKCPNFKYLFTRELFSGVEGGRVSRTQKISFPIFEDGEGVI